MTRTAPGLHAAMSTPAAGATLLDEPYFRQPAPKAPAATCSMARLAAGALAPGGPMAPIDVQATLCELTARAIADDVRRDATRPPSCWCAAAVRSTGT